MEAMNGLFADRPEFESNSNPTWTSWKSRTSDVSSTAPKNLTRLNIATFLFVRGEASRLQQPQRKSVHRSRKEVSLRTGEACLPTLLRTLAQDHA